MNTRSSYRPRRNRISVGSTPTSASTVPRIPPVARRSRGEVGRSGAFSRRMRVGSRKRASVPNAAAHTLRPLSLDLRGARRPRLHPHGPPYRPTLPQQARVGMMKCPRSRRHRLFRRLLLCVVWPRFVLCPRDMGFGFRFRPANYDGHGMGKAFRRTSPSGIIENLFVLASRSVTAPG